MSLPSHNSDDLLIPAADDPRVPPPPREAHFGPTLRVLRRRRRWRRAMYALSLAGCYIAGVGTLALLRPASAGGEQVVVRSPSNPETPSGPETPNQPTSSPQSGTPSHDPAGDPPQDQFPITRAPANGAPESPATAAIPHPSDRDAPAHDTGANAESPPVEIAAAPVVASRFASFCALGDLNLMQRRDPEAASRAYRLALRYATPDERAWAATDGTWLLRAINLADFTNTVSATNSNTTKTPAESQDASHTPDIRS